MERKLFLKKEEGVIDIYLADSFMRRLLGWMGRRESDYGLLLSPCRSVHTCFMRFSLDIFFLDKDYCILEVIQDLKPWRMTKTVKEAQSVLEIPSSMHLELKPGMYLDFQPCL